MKFTVTVAKKGDGWRKQGIKRLKRLLKPAKAWAQGLQMSILAGLLGGVISLLLVGCASRAQPVRLLELPDLPNPGESKKLSGSINEVAPPAIFLDLDGLLEKANRYQQPQVAIASPKDNQTIDSTTLSVNIKLSNFSIYKDEQTHLGPHLQVTLDNQPAQAIYSLDDPIVFSDLSPGSHTLRVLAVKPWGESFKNETAYAQTTFHVFANTGENTPDSDQPQLIYNEPQGTYGAQPILLDFYLNNAPLHLIAKDDPTVTDWEIRCNINGQSFAIDQWQPTYLKGFQPGQNWVQLTLIDQQGNPIANAFNSTVHIINFDPELRDTLAKMTRGELLIADAGTMVDPQYEPPLPLTEPPETQEEEKEETPAEESQASPSAAKTLSEPVDNTVVDEPNLETDTPLQDEPSDQPTTIETDSAANNAPTIDSPNIRKEGRSEIDLSGTEPSGNAPSEKAPSEKAPSEKDLLEKDLNSSTRINEEAHQTESTEPSEEMGEIQTVEEQALEDNGENIPEKAVQDKPGLDEPGLDKPGLDKPEQITQNKTTQENTSSSKPSLLEQIQAIWQQFKAPQPTEIKPIEEPTGLNSSTDLPDVLPTDSPLAEPKVQQPTLAKPDLDELTTEQLDATAPSPNEPSANEPNLDNEPIDEPIPEILIAPKATIP